MGFRKNATVIFVPGAWADGSSWGTVINSVAEAGLGVICAPIPLATLSDDIAAVRRVIARIDGPVLLVAHAYAGAVIAGVDGEQVKGLVYITALAPDEGETTVEVFTREASHPDAPKMAPDGSLAPHALPTILFSWLPGVNFATRRAFILIVAPVWGFRPFRL